MTEAFNMDCITAMKQMDDNAFDLAIVDPVYGDVTQGGYMFGKGGEHVANRGNYHLGLWNQEKTGKDYFDELRRVSRNQVIWGGQLLYIQLAGISMLDRMGQITCGGRKFCGC